MSSDVSNLFAKIPPSEVNDLVSNLLDPNSKQEILLVLRFCLKRNYFQFNFKNFSCKEGLIIRNPLSRQLAEHFTNDIEMLIHLSLLPHQFLYWYRHVDDIIGCFICTNRPLTNFFHFINSIHNRINHHIQI